MNFGIEVGGSLINVAPLGLILNAQRLGVTKMLPRWGNTDSKNNQEFYSDN